MLNNLLDDAEWQDLLTFLPKDCFQSDEAAKALKGLRKDKCPQKFLRVLLMHVVGGMSLRETVARARIAGLADLSDTGLMYRFQRAMEWLKALCVALFKERSQRYQAPFGEEPFRLFDSTIVKEPGKTGSQWRISYSIQIPAMVCDYFKITPTRGPGTGETLKQYEFSPGDRILADRGFSQAPGLHEAARHGATFCVRLNSSSLPLQALDGTPFDLLAAVAPLRRIGSMGNFPVLVPLAGEAPLRARLCVIRKSAEATARAKKKLRRRASKDRQKLRHMTLVLADFVVLVTTFPEAEERPEQIFEWYRMRWQIELVFKKLKQKLKLGHIPKHDDESVKAWLYGKLLAALLIEKIRDYATALSPWGYELDARPVAKQLA